MGGKETWLSILGICVTAAAAGWYLQGPKDPAQLFRARCSSCHELREQEVCRYGPQMRPAIVDTMRHLHGAGTVIDEEEAVVIKRYLAEGLRCPQNE